MIENGAKYLTAERLIELLSTLPPETRVFPNDLRNLWFESADQDGWIDFLGEGEVKALA